MDRLMALAVSSGVLFALWFKLGALTGLTVPAGIVAWACFVAAGGKTLGLQRTIAATLSGVVWVWLAMTVIGALNLGGVAWLVIGLAAFCLVIQSRLAVLSFIPGALSGAAVTTWAAPTDPKGYVMVAVALVAGALFGYLAELGAGRIAKQA